MTTPVSTYFETSIKKSANFSFRWFTIGFFSVASTASSCLLICGFCGFAFSSRCHYFVVLRFDAAKISIFRETCFFFTRDLSKTHEFMSNYYENNTELTINSWKILA